MRTQRSGFRICPECDGAKKCTRCGGTGVIEKKKPTKVPAKDGNG